jgi:hypothetical protein
MTQSEERTQEWQEWMLGRLVEQTFVRKTQGVKGPYTTGDFVIWMLNTIFGPANWSHKIVSGPELTRYNDQLAYSQVTVRLEVRFANGGEVIHEDIGIWPMTATRAREGGTLDETAPERFEQVVKSAITDGLKACTDYLGNCFRPIADAELEGFIRRRQGEESLKAKGKSAAGELAEKSNNDLFGEDTSRKADLAPEQPAPSGDGQVPKHMGEFYSMAESIHGISKPDALDCLAMGLSEEVGSGTTVKDALDKGMTVEELWGVLITYAP